MIEDKGNQLILPDEAIINKIYLVRGKKVMLDKDLAELYQVKALRLRQQVNRNMERFPENFMFRLTQEETDFMVSQNAIPSRQHLGGHLPLKLERIEQKLLGHDENILLIFEYLKQLEQAKHHQDDQANRKRIGFRHDD
jgi:hypothetical protein